MSYAKMMGTMSRNPHCFGHKGHGKDGDPGHTHARKKKVTLDKGKDPLSGLEPPTEPKSYPGPGTRVPPVLRASPLGNQFPGAGKKKGKKPVTILHPPQPRAGGGRRYPGPDQGTGPYNPNQRRSRTGGGRGLSPMQRRNEQGLRRVKVR